MAMMDSYWNLNSINAQILDFIENEKKLGPRLESIKMYGNT